MVKNTEKSPIKLLPSLYFRCMVCYFITRTIYRDSVCMCQKLNLDVYVRAYMHVATVSAVEFKLVYL